MPNNQITGNVRDHGISSCVDQQMEKRIKTIGNGITTKTKIRRCKNYLANDYKGCEVGNRTINIKMDKCDDCSVKNKLISNKIKKLIKPMKSRKSKIRAERVAKNIVMCKQPVKEEQGKTENLRFSPDTSGTKILRPCVYTLQGKPCLSEINCPYLHSDFPCKYHYLNIPCPQNLKCRFMHGGLLEPELKDALRNHILELLSTKPSGLETHFVQQIYYIDDLSRRLQNFRLQNLQMKETKNNEVIEMLDDGDQEFGIVSNEESKNYKSSHNAATTIKDSLPTTSGNKFDIVYANITKTNSTIGEIENKLKILKTKAKMTSEEKINELQNIYGLLKEQERQLKMYDTEVHSVADNIEVSITVDGNDVLGNPIPNDTPTLDNFYYATTDEMDPSQPTLLRATQHAAIGGETAENLTDCDVKSFIGEKLSDHVSFTYNGNSALTEFQKQPYETIERSRDHDYSLTNQTESCALPKVSFILDGTNDENVVSQTNTDKVNFEKEEIYSSPTSEKHLRNTTKKINVRCNAVHENEDKVKKIDEETLVASTASDRNKSYRTCPLKFPKHRKINSKKPYIENTAKEPLLKDEGHPLTQNVILTNFCMKKVRIKLKRQIPKVKKNIGTFVDKCSDANVDKNILALQSEEVKAPTVTEYMNKNNSLTVTNVPSKDTSFYNMENVKIGTSIYIENVNKNRSDSTDFTLPADYKNSETTQNANSKQQVYIETSPAAFDTLSSIDSKEKYKAGNGKMVLSKVKDSISIPVVSKKLLADFNNCFDSPGVTSHNLENKINISSSKDNNCLKTDNSNSVGKFKIDSRKETFLQQGTDLNSRNEFYRENYIPDFETESFDESLNATSSYNSSERKQIFEPPSTCEQQSESDLLEQNENVSNKSDLKLQAQQDKDVENTLKSTTASFITKNSKHSPNKQYQEQGKLKMNKPDLLYPKKCDRNEAEELEYFGIVTSSDIIEKELNFKEENINADHSSHSKKLEINIGNSIVNVTPISSPTYENDTIASPLPFRECTDFCMGDEVDGRLTNPPMPYCLYAIDLEKIEVNKPPFIDKLKKTIQLDPRIFRTDLKLDFSTLVPVTVSNRVYLSQRSSSPTVSRHDPRNRSSALMSGIPKSSLLNETALTPYTSWHTATASSSSLSLSSMSSSFFHSSIPNAVPFDLHYPSTSQPIIYPQPLETINKFLYCCLQRSPWYQSLLSTMKIEINQSISQLVRALKKFHRQRACDPEMVFDIFKIDCAGELLEIMHNLGIFVDAHGVINEHRNVTSFGGNGCCNNGTSVNVSCNSIQQFLTPRWHSNVSATASSQFKTACSAPVCNVNVKKPIVTCYVREPEQLQNNSYDSTAKSKFYRDVNSNNSRCNKHNSNKRRHDKQYKKLFDNDKAHLSQSSYYSSNYISKSRFMKPVSGSPAISKSPPTISKRRGSNDDLCGSEGSRGGGCFNKKRVVSNHKTNDYNNRGGHEKRYSIKYENEDFPRNSSKNSRSPRPSTTKTLTPSPNHFVKASKPNTNESDEECWDSDN